MADTHKAAFTQSRPWSETEFSDLLSNRFTYVVGDKSCFALIQVIAGEAELLTIATQPDHQRQGLAAQVMSAWHTQAISQGAGRAFLDVAVDNTPAIALYHRCGYALHTRRPGYYKRSDTESIDAIVMQRPLP
ncbi:GNAT family N-acetyltransferase [Tropicibacter sp. Alg240-R139]|uniref:GNAT family N-acetyltransferase n=1 Tax=Tropicibacter sp. Alg240-R139 TaxID=2305991 RepID=UPI001F07FB71|nr:GNAT family N-acetyltransferase [Tropicibacter sp. Alg240-R139]